MFELRAKSERITDMLMYGSVGEWGKIRAEDVWKNLQSAKTQGYEKVRFRLNCPGGSIFEGIAVISAIQNAGIDVALAIDGMAASMGAAFVAAIEDVEMVEGARLMIHQGSGMAMGQAWQIRDQADLLESLNRTLAEYVAKKTGKDKQWIIDNWMAPGKDKWFTAEEALAAKLIKRIVPGKIKPLEKEQASFYEMAAYYQSQLDTTENAMNKETRDALIKLYGLKAEATDAEILAAATAAKPATPPATPPTAENKAGATTATTDPKIVDNVVAIAKAKGVTDEKKINGLKLLAQLDVQAALDMIEASGKAPESNTETGKPEPVQNINEMLKNLANNGGSAAVNKNNWKWADWNKPENAKEFAELLEKEPKKYAALFKAEFNYEPTEAELKSIRF